MSDSQQPIAPVQRSSEPEPSQGSPLPYFLAAVLVFVIAYGVFTIWRVQRNELVRGEAVPINAIGPPLTEFELTERSGKPFRSADMRGKVWVATYFFTNCPGSCVRLNQNIKLLNEMPELKDVTWVSISCDPDNDTVEALQKYADTYHADPERWLFCRGDLPYVQRVGLGMKMDVQRQGHKEYAIVIDKAGQIRGMYNGTSRADCEKLVARLQELLDEPAPSDMAASPAADETTR